MTPSFHPVRSSPEPVARSLPGPAALTPRVPPWSDDRALRAFTSKASTPKTTFALVLVAVTVSVLAMQLDAVPRYSHLAFFAGLGLTVVLAIVVGTCFDTLEGSRWRHASTLLLPTLFGALIGTVVQAIVLAEVGTSWSRAVKDLGGLVDTTEPIAWVASGVALGGLPALLVSVFLVLAGRSIRSIAGHDASEAFGVAFVGFSGLVAAFGLVLVDGIAVPPLLLVTAASVLALVVALLVDGSRLRFLRRLYQGRGDGFEIVQAERFAADPTLAPLVAKAGSAAVLVRLAGSVGSYRSAGIEPVALLADTEHETLRPLIRRRAAAFAMLAAMGVLGCLALLVQG